MNSDLAISVHHLTRRFGEKVAVDKLTLDVYSGEVFGFLGHNGAGKTTTIRLLNGILSPSAGRITVLGMDPATQGPALRRRTGVLTETPALEELLTARDNLRIYADLYAVPRTEIAGRVEGLLTTFGLANQADKKVQSYSKGMKQRLALARAMLHNPDILFLDEPTDGLDPLAARLVRELIMKLSHQEQRTVFLCTHNLLEAQQLCDRVAVLEQGRLRALGTPAELIHQLERGMRLDIEVSPQSMPLALNILRTVPGVAIASGEDGFIALVGADRAMVPRLLSTLVAAGIAVYRVTPHELSLEDVYFALHSQEVQA